ncbi:glutaredoxin 3 [Gorgonomyces haynaldii]|nr:glutaredoxin 3 [Gorgonomyces haynaldii]
MANVKSLVTEIIQKNRVVVFSKSYCPYCDATKRLLNQKKVTYELLELDQRPDGAAIQDALLSLTSQRTVPNIFISEKHIGGNSDLQALESKGQLDPLLA